MVGLLARGGPQRALEPQPHQSAIMTGQPDRVWGPDLTTPVTTREGQATVLEAVHQHASIPATRRATRSQALRPLPQAARERSNRNPARVAKRPALRHDHDRQYAADSHQRGCQPDYQQPRAPEVKGGMSVTLTTNSAARVC